MRWRLMWGQIEIYRAFSRASVLTSASRNGIYVCILCRLYRHYIYIIQLNLTRGIKGVDLIVYRSWLYTVKLNIRIGLMDRWYLGECFFVLVCVQIGSNDHQDWTLYVCVYVCVNWQVAKTLIILDMFEIYFKENGSYYN